MKSSAQGFLSDEERAWVERALRRRRVTPEQVREAVEIRARSEDPAAPLEVVLVSLGYLREDDVEALGKTTGRVPVLMPVPEPAELVEIYGSCTVLEPLGRGPSGPVYLALHGDSGRRVALKVIPDNSLNRPFRRRFARHAQMALGLSHPRAARVLEAGVQGKALYVATELVGGTTLRELIRTGGPIPWRRASAVLAQVAGALQAAHAIGLLHGNLKPENVFVGGKLEVKVTDFGLGRADAEFLKDHADKAGTLIYSLAPEQWSRETVPASDLYACGVLWHFMLTGRYPFEGRTFREIRRLHEKGEPPALRVGPAGVDALAKMLLAKDPSRRPASAGDLIEALAALDSGRPPTVRIPVAGPSKTASKTRTIRRGGASPPGRASKM